MKNIIVSFLAVSLITVWSCQSDSSNMQSFDLLPYGVPISIKVPVDSPSIKKSDGFLGQKELAIKAGSQFDLLVAYEPAETSDLAKLKAEQIASVKDIANFSKIIEEEEKGFIYETQIDSTNLYYGFRYVHLQGDQKYIFQSGLIGAFSLEDVQAMYSAIKQ